MTVVKHQGEPLARSVTTCDGLLSQTRGVIGREPKPGEAFLFRFDRPSRRRIHMVCVRRPLDVVWLRDGHAHRIETLSPWTDTAAASADAVLELPAGRAEAVAPADPITINGGSRS